MNSVNPGEPNKRVHKSRFKKKGKNESISMIAFDLDLCVNNIVT